MFQSLFQKLFAWFINLNKKKLFIILGAILVIFLATIILLKKKPPKEIPVKKPPIVELPQPPVGAPKITTPEAAVKIPQIPTVEGIIEEIKPKIEIKKTISQTALTSVLSSDEKNIFYFDKKEGKIYQALPDGTNPQAISEKFYQVEKVNWSPDRTKIALTFPDKTNVIYDLANKRSYILDSHIQEVDFSYQNNQLAYKYLGENSARQYLMISKFDGSEAQVIEHLGENEKNLQIDWSPTNKVVALLKESVSDQESEVYFVGLHGENYKSTLVSGFGFKSIWSPKGDKILYSVWNKETDYKPKLWLVEAEDEKIGQNRQDLGIYTFVEKCLWAKDNLTIFCAVPERLEQGAGMVKELAASTKDSLWKINTQTGIKTQIASNSDLKGIETIEHLEISSDQKTIYLTDKQTGKVYQISIK